MLTFHVIMKKVFNPAKGAKEIRFENRRNFLRENGHRSLMNRKNHQSTIVVETDGNGRLLNYGVSICSGDDHFVRRDGRNYAINLMNTGKCIPNVNLGLTNDEMAVAVSEYVFNTVGCH